MLELEDGRLTKLKDIEVNDELKSGDRILGIVKIEGTHLRDIKQYNIENTIFIGGPNLRIKDKYLGEFSTIGMEGEKIENIPILFIILSQIQDF